MSEFVDYGDKDEVKDEFELAGFAFVLFAVELVAVQPLADQRTFEQVSQGNRHVVAVNLDVWLVGWFAPLATMHNIEQASGTRVLVQAPGSTT